MAERPVARPVARGGVRDAERALAPDLARGLMMLLIALSNTVFHLWAAEHGPSGWHPVDGTTTDRVVQFAMIVGLDLRVYPLFAFLFGYGMAQLYGRQVEAGTEPRTARALLRRRSLWLIVFGFAHAALLMAGDILGAWGLLSLVLGWLFVSRRSGTLLIWSGLGVATMVLPAIVFAVAILVGGVPAAPPGADTQPTVEVYASDEPDPLAAAAVRVTTWLFVTLTVPASPPAVVGMLLGMWAARRRILEEPSAHLRLHGVTAAVGVAVGWLGGLPSALVHVGLLAVDPGATSASGALYGLQVVTGLGGGLGYVALAGLAVHLMSARWRTSTPVVAVAAVGKRSLSAYLAHSLMFAPVLAAWGIGVGAQLASASMALFAVGVWLVTVLGAHALERRGLRGPAEAVLRRLVYR